MCVEKVESMSDDEAIFRHRVFAAAGGTADRADRQERSASPSELPLNWRSSWRCIVAMNGGWRPADHGCSLLLI
jgi:hypothetical protein